MTRKVFISSLPLKLARFITAQLVGAKEELRPWARNEELHAYLHTSRRAPSQPVQQHIHEPSSASHPQTRPVIIAGLSDRARQELPLHVERACLPVCVRACVRVVLCCVDGRQFNTNSAEGKLWLFSPKLKSDGLLMFVCLFFLSRTTANFFFALCSHVFFRRGHSQKGKPSSEQGNMAVVWAVTSSCLSALYLSSAARHCHSPCRSLLPGVTDGSSLFAASLHSLVCVPFFSCGWLNDC